MHLCFGMSLQDKASRADMVFDRLITLTGILLKVDCVGIGDPSHLVLAVITSHPICMVSML